MKLPTLTAAAIGAGLCVIPVSANWSSGEGGTLSMSTAQAAELDVAPYEGVRRRYVRRYHVRRVVLYHPFCGGPYVGGGWNGGSYYGGPWMDLRCYGILPMTWTPPSYYWR